MAVIPPANLPEPAQPWGRDIQQKVEDGATSLARLTQDSSNNSKQLNASIQLLSEQVAFISSFKTFQTNDPSITMATTPGVAVNKALSLPFTLPRTATVLIQLGVDFDGQVDSTAGNGLIVRSTLSTVIDGVTQPIVQSANTVGLLGPSITAFGMSSATNFSKSYIKDMNAAAHTVSATWTAVFGNTSVSTNFARLQNAIIMVSVIG